MYTRRELVAGALGTVAVALPIASTAQEAKKHMLFVGTYTGMGSQGIYVLEMDSETGALGTPRLVAETPNPSFLAIHPKGELLFACNEIGNYNGEKTGSVTGFRLNPKGGALSKINTQASKGADPCHVVMDSAGKHLLTANYSGGSVAVHPVREDGTLSEAGAAVHHAGRSVDKARHEGPHAHSIYLTPGEKFAIVADLGLDKVLVYKYFPSQGLLGSHDVPPLKVAPGSGPRHIGIHPSGRFLFVINEMLSTVSVFGWDKEAGTGNLLQTITTLPPGYTGSTSTAEIEVHPSGRFVYGSNRGHDSIAVFSVEDASGMLTPIQHMPTGGKTPRNFVLHPSGRWLLAANQSTNDIRVFKLDIATGMLTATPHKAEVSMPVCLRFHPGAA